VHDRAAAARASVKIAGYAMRDGTTATATSGDTVVPNRVRPVITLGTVNVIRVEIPVEVAERLAERALKEHVSPEELASEAVCSFVGPVVSSKERRALGFIGLGHSGRSDISERG
jgi:hypothetical protein